MKDIRRNKGIIAIIVLLFTSVTFLVSSMITPEFKSETSILILQKNMDINAYQASKASEFAGEVMKRIVNSSDFMNGVLEKIGRTPQSFGDTPENQVKNWGDSVNISSVLDTGIIKITVFEKNQAENRKLTEAIISELQNNGVKYHGNENITLKKISGPVYFEKQTYPNVWLNMLVAAVAGLFFSIGWIFISVKRKSEELYY